ncbi:cyclin-t1-5-like protein [Trifolium pratense]|uniref:Cyclin-t1-5-like protein n=1 Tax=Trifolium pratense TaxID=57577 RepID=A0A2K3JKM7_TRIPR|nr:cyclin-t1-5-like protein [Trifolium pratense]
MDDDDLIERELEDIDYTPPHSEKSKQDRRQSWSKLSDRSDYDNTHGRHQDHADEQPHGIKGLPSLQDHAVEEGEVSAFDDVSVGLPSPKSSNRKRKAGSSPDRVVEGKQRHNYGCGSHHNNRSDYVEDQSKDKPDSKFHLQTLLVTWSMFSSSTNTASMTHTSCVGKSSFTLVMSTILIPNLAFPRRSISLL